MKINQKEIAKRAGVSQTTVSFVLNNRRDIKISSEVRRRVIEIAEELGYKKIFVIREDGFKTGNIGYIFPSSISFTDPYYHRFYKGVIEGLNGRNLNLLLKSVEKPDELLYNFDIIKNCDGLIIEEKLEEEIIEKIKEKIPVVLLNTKAEKVDVDYVMPDNKGGIIKAVGYLYRKGHKKIGFFGLKPLGIHQEERLEGYIEGLKLYGLKIKEEYISLPERKVGGLEEVREYAEETLKNWIKLRERPTAIITLGDVYALGIIGVSERLGINIPDDISVIGFDNIINCLYSHPSLTSIEQPIEDMGKKAVELLIERIKNPGKPVEKVRFEVEIIERESVKELRL